MRIGVIATSDPLRNNSGRRMEVTDLGVYKATPVLRRERRYREALGIRV
jgi:hypothetical protein